MRILRSIMTGSICALLLGANVAIAATDSPPEDPLATFPEMLRGQIPTTATSGLPASDLVRIPLSRVKTQGAATPSLQNARHYITNQNPIVAARFLEEALALEPANRSLRLALASLFLELRDYSRSLEVVESLLTKKNALAETHAIAGTALLELGEFDRAMDSFERLTVLAADSPSGYALIAEALWRKGDPERAKRIFDVAISKGSTDQHVRLRGAAIRLQLGQTRAALERLHELAVEFPDDSTVHQLLAQAQEASGDEDAALGSYRKAIGLGPSSQLPYDRAAAIFASKGNTGGEIEILSRILERDPSQRIARDRLISLYVETEEPARATHQRAIQAVLDGQLDEATRQFEKSIGEDPDFVDVLLDHAALELQIGRANIVQKLAAKAVTIDPGSPTAHNLLGQAASMLGEPDAALEHFRAAVAADPRYWPAILNLANRYRAERKLQDAVHILEGALETAPGAPRAFELLGICYFENGAFEKAARTHDRILAQGWNRAVFLNRLAWIYTELGTRLDVALVLAGRARELAPSDPTVANTLGWLQSLTGKHALAVANLEVATQLLPADPSVAYRLGAAQFRAGQFEAAAIQLERSLAIGGEDFRQATAARDLLARARASGTPIGSNPQAPEIE